MISWISEQYIEILGVAFSLLYLFFSIRKNILLWPMGIISALLYMVVFFQSRFYADMALNGYYFVISIYGWIIWKRGAEGEGEGLPVTRIGRKLAGVLGAFTLATFIATGLILDHFTDSPLPYWDAFTTAIGITATWMLARKILEHWILWIIVDLVSMGLYLYRGLYPTMVLFALYTMMAVIGFIQWKKNLQNGSL